MGRLKLSPDAAKLKAVYPDGVLEDPKPIAQRFAYAADLELQAPARQADPLAASRPAEPLEASETAASAAGILQRLSVIAGMARRTGDLRARWLIAGFVAAVLVPSLVLGVAWLGSSREPQQAPALGPAEPEAMAPSPVLTTPERVAISAGGQASFPIALDGTDGVPPRSIIAVRGLPPGSNLSEGRANGEGEWALLPDQIGELSLALPPGASGQFKLAIVLIDPSDKIIAEAETLLDVAAAPADQPATAEADTVVPGGNLAAFSAPNPVTDGNEAAPSAPSPAPDNSLMALPAPVPYGGEAPASAASAQQGPGSAADPEASAATEAAGPPHEGLPEQAEQPAKAENAPSIRPSTVGQPADGENDLDTVEPSVFVNLREEPSSSAPVLGVVAKGAKLPVLDRKRGWVKVADRGSGKEGWIYSGLLVGEAKPDRVKRVAPAEPEPKSENFWGRLGRWLRPSEGS